MSRTVSCENETSSPFSTSEALATWRGRSDQFVSSLEFVSRRSQKETHLNLCQAACRHESNTDGEEAVDVLRALDSELEVAARFIGVDGVGPPVERRVAYVVRPRPGVGRDVELETMPIRCTGQEKKTSQRGTLED